MGNEDKKKYRDALEVAQRELAKRSFAKIAELAGAEEVSDSRLVIRYSGQLVRVHYPEGEVECCCEADSEPALLDITDKIAILQYLTEVCGVPPSGKWISFRELPGGNNHYMTFKQEAIDPLARCFGDSPEKFAQACEKRGGRRLNMGDIAYAIPVLPKIEIAFVLWLADDEFPAQANILYDSAASMHLNTEGLEVLAGNTVEKMIGEQA